MTKAYIKDKSEMISAQRTSNVVIPEEGPLRYPSVDSNHCESLSELKKPSALASSITRKSGKIDDKSPR